MSTSWWKSTSMYTRDYAIKDFTGRITSDRPVIRWSYPVTPTSAITALLHEGFLGEHAADETINVKLFLNIVTYIGEVRFNDITYPMMGDDLLELQLACLFASPDTVVNYH